MQIFMLLLGLDFLGLILTFAFNDTIILDELEHLRASWFVSNGEMPYRDFFEHHHPLIWFMYSPIIKALPTNIFVALYTAKLLAFGFSAGSMLIIYRLSNRYLGGKFAAIISLAFFFVYFTTWYSFSIFKPDTFMRFFYLWGLYCFFVFCESKQTSRLTLCGICFAIAFLFLQTIIFSILPLIFPLGWMLYKKQINPWQIIRAAIFPLLIIGTTAAWFWWSGTWESYFQLNWIYNSKLFTIIHSHSPRIIGTFMAVPLAAYIMTAIVYYQKKADFYFNLVVILLICETLQHLVLPAIFPHYLVLLLMFSALIIGYALNLCAKRWVFNLSYIMLFISIVFNCIIVAITNNSASHNFMRECNRNPRASIVNLDVTFFSIYAPKYSYYWFYPGFEYIDNVLFDRVPDYDINRIIRDNQVEYIVVNPNYSFQNVTQRFNWNGINKRVKIRDYFPRHAFDEAILQNYEEVSTGLYKRKNLSTNRRDKL